MGFTEADIVDVSDHLAVEAFDRLAALTVADDQGCGGDAWVGW
jgi:hypothetical protein